VGGGATTEAGETFLGHDAKAAGASLLAAAYPAVARKCCLHVEMKGIM
jgi:hypothetical protein